MFSFPSNKIVQSQKRSVERSSKICLGTVLNAHRTLKSVDSKWSLNRIQIFQSKYAIPTSITIASALTKTEDSIEALAFGFVPYAIQAINTYKRKRKYNTDDE